MDAERVEMQIAALLDQADVEHARVREAIGALKATSVALQQDVTSAAGRAVQDAFAGLQKDIERARSAMKWVSYRWIVIVVVSLMGLFALGVGLAWALLALQRHQVTELIERKTALEADIADMTATQAVLEKKGARIKITDCGGRLCIVANKRQSDDATDWHGIWNNEKTGETFVIPKGY
jgi:hypothetical protein